MSLLSNVNVRFFFPIWHLSTVFSKWNSKFHTKTLLFFELKMSNSVPDIHHSPTASLQLFYSNEDRCRKSSFSCGRFWWTCSIRNSMQRLVSAIQMWWFWRGRQGLSWKPNFLRFWDEETTQFMNKGCSWTKIIYIVISNHIEMIWDVYMLLNNRKIPKYAKIRVSRLCHLAHILISDQENSLENIRWDVLPHAAYSPSLTLSDNYLFRSMQHGLSEQHFKTNGEVRNWLDGWWGPKDERWYWCGVNELPKCGEKP